MLRQAASIHSPLNLDLLAPLIGAAKEIARRYRAVTGRPLGNTGEVAEYEAARLLGLELAGVRQAGYDAIRRIGDAEEHLQIKGRWLLSKKPGQRLGSIDLDKDWDGVLLVLLDSELEPIAIYEADRSAVALLAVRSGQSEGDLRERTKECVIAEPRL